MTKSELISEIESFYTIIGTPIKITSSDEHIPKQINHYSILVYETGLSEKNKKPVLNSKYINFIVLNENNTNESAYYANDELENNTNTDFTGNDSLTSISKIYESTQLRKRIRSAIMKAANNIFNEEPPSSPITSNTNKSKNKKTLNVTDSSKFAINQTITISDDNANETNTITNIFSNTLTLLNDLQHDFLTTSNAYISSNNNNDRRLWAANALLNPEKYTLAMTTFAVLDPTVQSHGNSIPDTSLQTIINNNISKLASATRIA